MPRTPKSVERKRAYIIRRMEREKVAKLVKYGERAVKRAKRAGVCGYTPATADDKNWIFGPDKDKDNIFQAVPQVTLHGFDEGLVKKMNFGALEMLVTYRMEKHGMKAAQVIKYIITYVIRNVTFKLLVNNCSFLIIQNTYVSF
jgi:hypothetical protein